MRSAWLAQILLAAAAFAQGARAEPGRFVWQAPECVSSGMVFERRLASLIEPRDRERLTGTVVVRRAADRYGVDVTIAVDGRRVGTRRFEVRQCAQAAETAAVAASLAVYDGETEPKAAAESGISPDIWTRGPEPVPDFSRRAITTAAWRLPLEARLGLLGVLEIGALPHAGWGGALEFGLAVGERWSFNLLGSKTAEQRRPVREQEAVLLSTWSGAARACVAPLLRAHYRLDGCAGAQLMLARGQGDGFDINRSASLTWASPLLGMDFSVQAPTYLEWRWELDAAVPLSRRRFLVDGGEVSRAAPLVGTVRLGAVLRF